MMVKPCLWRTNVGTGGTLCDRRESVKVLSAVTARPPTATLNLKEAAMVSNLNLGQDTHARTGPDTPQAQGQARPYECSSK